jgi:hypothetical protein
MKKVSIKKSNTNLFANLQLTEKQKQKVKGGNIGIQDLVIG